MCLSVYLFNLSIFLPVNDTIEGRILVLDLYGNLCSDQI